MWTPRPRAGAAVAGLACAVLLSACGGGDAAPAASSGATADPAPPSVDPPTPSGGAGEATGTVGGPTSGLAGGLLPAEAFGAGATVTPLSRAQLEQGAALAADPGSLTITPEGCAAAVEGTQPQIEDYDEVAAQSATVGGSTTVEVLLRGKATAGAVDVLADAATNCPEARISSPQLGEAVLTFEALDVPDVGDGAAAVRYTTTLTQGGQEVSVPALVGLVRDGDRVITLLTIVTDGSQPDATAFASLLEQAFEVQAEALG